LIPKLNHAKGVQRGLVYFSQLLLALLKSIPLSTSGS